MRSEFSESKERLCSALAGSLGYQHISIWYIYGIAILLYGHNTSGCLLCPFLNNGEKEAIKLAMHRTIKTSYVRVGANGNKPPRTNTAFQRKEDRETHIGTYVHSTSSDGLDYVREKRRGEEKRSLFSFFISLLPAPIFSILSPFLHFLSSFSQVKQREEGSIALPQASCF